MGRTGFGGVLAFSVKGDFDNVRVFLNSLELVHLGIPENLIRCALGIENIEDIIADFDQALLKI